MVYVEEYVPYNNNLQGILIIFFQVIRQTHIYHSVGKSRSIILSSGARSGIELRSPHDVINLGHGLFNLNEQQAKNSLTKLATDAVKSGAGRRLGPFRCVIMHLEQAKLKQILNLNSKI